MQAIHVSLKPETLFYIGSFPMTNSFLIALLISVCLIIFFALVARRLQTVPGRTQLIMESFVSFLYQFVRSSTAHSGIIKYFFPIFATLAAFFLCANLLGLLPFWSALSFNGTPLYRAATADYGMILILTVSLFVLWQGVSLITGGPLGYLKKFLNFSSPLNFVLGLLDIVGEMAKIISLSFRLFGNIFAGEVIGSVMLALAPFIMPLPFTLLGLIGSVVQAFIFPILVLIFMNMAIIEKEPTPTLAS